MILSQNILAQDKPTALSEIGIHLIPYPQEVNLEGADFILNNHIVIDPNATEKDKFAAHELSNTLHQEYKQQTNITSTAKTNAIILTRKGAPKDIGEEGYHVTVNDQQLSIHAQGEAGLFYGAQTLLQLIQKNASEAPYIKGMEIKDWPDTPQRAAHYDTKHHQDKKEYVKSFIRDLARYKINMLVWEWEDKFAYPSHPEIGAPGAFTMEEMQEFTRYAQQHHVQIVPLVQGLGHVSFILKWPQYAHLREIPASNWEFAPLKMAPMICFLISGKTLLKPLRALNTFILVLMKPLSLGWALNAR
ncbi:beta-N-acetylhexosaminidase [Catalinimonas alkaloidigena]|uniref:beta-N-acetylhexosaminidase n=1 Tax=Catalinimonas alkaloidigena TaxID=1075417 RepID=UPI002406317B|nr:beta-N-acetylhexosaminidase [Catalinimonas alkaloidigena]